MAPQRRRPNHARSQYRHRHHPRSHRLLTSAGQLTWRAAARQRFCLRRRVRPKNLARHRLLVIDEVEISLYSNRHADLNFRTRQPQLRAQQHDRHHQKTIAEWRRGFSKRRLRRIHGRSHGTQRRGPRHREGNPFASRRPAERSRAAPHANDAKAKVRSKRSTVSLTISLKIPASLWTAGAGLRRCRTC